MNTKLVRTTLTVAAISAAGILLAACHQHGRGHHHHHGWNERSYHFHYHDRDRHRDRDRRGHWDHRR